MKNISVLFACFFLLNACRAQPRALTPDQWRADFRFLLDHMADVHLDAYHSTSRDAFERWFAELSPRLDGLTANQTLVELLRGVALIGDGHTSVQLFNFHGHGGEPPVVVHVLPVWMEVFDDGVFVTQAMPDYADLVGKKVEAVGSMDIERYRTEIGALTPRDNAYQLRFMFPFYGQMTELIEGLGASSQAGPVELRFAGGVRRTMVPVGIRDFHRWLRAQPVPEDAPLHRHMVAGSAPYWYRYLPEDRILYVAYQAVLQDPADSLSHFVRRLDALRREKLVDKVVVDIRHNGGGNNFTCKPLVDWLRQPEINRRGHLFCVLGAQTFSAASYFTTKLELTTETIFVGEPTGASPNHYGDNRPLRLPNSGLEVRLSAIYWVNSLPGDPRASTEPLLRVPNRSADYFAGKDPVMDLVRAISPATYERPAALSGALPGMPGRYAFSPVQMAEVLLENGHWVLKIKDVDRAGRPEFFLNTTLLPAGKNRYETAIEGVAVQFDESKNALLLDFRGQVVEMPALPAGYETLDELFASGRNDAAFARIDSLRRQNPAHSMLSEAFLNAYGYNWLKRNNNDAAIRLFTLMTELYPRSGNAFDSLAEGYLLGGDEANALRFYEKALAVQPDYGNAGEAKKIVARLKKQ